ncbi:MAG TPA: alpha/beta hydrolase [Marmoricola sp.]|nr:alpha/beta hydrolase [Marmoricola sp.]
MNDATHLGRFDRRLPLASDASQWEFDLAVQQTGQVQHFWEPRRFPASVQMHAMVPKHFGIRGRRLERFGDVERAAGHNLTALDFYFEAAVAYGSGQHAIFVDNDEKRLLHSSSVRCYDAVRELAPRVIERVEFEFEGATLSGYLHLADVEGPAPLVFMISGIDMTKEMVPDPMRNWATERGMHLFVFDGPGQGSSNLNGFPLTVDNFERASSAALDVLLERREVAADQVVLYAMSFGSYWGARVAATEPRFAAVVLQWASVCDMNYLFNGHASPRYKQVLAFATRVGSEEELDAFINAMGLDELVGRISAPTLVTVGEFDQRSPLEGVYEFFDAMTCPRELWVFPDQHHRLSVRGGAGANTSGVDTHSFGMDWLQDRLRAVPLSRDGQVRYLDGSAAGPNDPRLAEHRHWYDA